MVGVIRHDHQFLKTGGAAVRETLDGVKNSFKTTIL